MKKLAVLVMAMLLSVVVIVKPASAEYLPQYDKYIEIGSDQARQLADELGLKGIPLGPQTAAYSFKVQESFIAKLEKISGKEIDHYYIWLTVNGVPVLGIDPPIVSF
ncbi:8-amino-7-oxononanoate synthase [Bacillus sp. USDA818B3_A]|uniref:8-amino-7-oxononanoate synthase n=1 Tax=Bacillus sp. USDA818B3_A TaxID=2698834 RepID=UPI00136980C6|nr:8-amino-7-oxononanoate synthase [Bacillus sp. USDA818B3_A]